MNVSDAKIIEIEGKQVKVVIKKPVEVRNGVVLYGQVLSFTNDARFYGVKKRRTGKGRYSYACQCDRCFYTGKACVHINAFVLVERTGAVNEVLTPRT